MLVFSKDGSKQYHVYADFHTHSTFSGHGMASPEEMVKAAKKLTLPVIAITDHAYDYTAKHDIKNQGIRPHLMMKYLSDDEITVLGGRELNTFTDNPAKGYAGINLCGWHSWFGPSESKIDVDLALRSHEYLLTHTDVMCHPERTAVMFEKDEDTEKFLRGICELAGKREDLVERLGFTWDNTMCFIEINTAPRKYFNICTVNRQFEMQMKLIKLLATDYKDIPIILGSDAHCTRDICCNFGEYLKVLEENGVDIDRVINVDAEWCKDFACIFDL